MTPSRIRTLAVVGTGLIGTSIALAARSAGVRVALEDRDERALAAAVARGAGTPLSEGGSPADLAVLAVPPRAVPEVLRDARERRLAAFYTDVASTKGEVVRRAGGAPDFVPGHPMAGAERSGPDAADEALFRGAAWVLCPGQGTAAAALDTVRELVALCGAAPLEMDADEHDRAVALVSHVPHVVASALAAALRGAGPDVLALTGRGALDTTRIAAGDPELWRQVLGDNARHVARELVEVATSLSWVAIALAEVAERGDRRALDRVTELLVRGCQGRAELLDAVRARR
ncbi:prephenate dehydrogenase [Saccharothrix variisporea]|uniref:Prephenate dehydrogenase n=1 Tax=Saccharothrix variisporea TaxID=543527 RepID=A0A495XQ68_9PSEU|nr:prephenate dehydrogenase/arogenate dehydrogenase family protein [Saccharothrix variisporea]RKT74593.1 prephenate dehydrogenase [Saccharothrix variisporea]